jgi:hypothetical protein
VSEKVYAIVSGSGPSKFEQSDPDPGNSRPDPQHYSYFTNSSLALDVRIHETVLSKFPIISCHCPFFWGINKEY